MGSVTTPSSRQIKKENDMTNADNRPEAVLQRKKNLEKWLERTIEKPPWAGMCKHGELLDKHCPACLKEERDGWSERKCE